MDELLRYDHVDISYNGVQVVKDLSFVVSPGEILGIVGESGSGKSTIIKAAMGLLGSSGLVTRVDIWYKGKNLPDLSPAELRRLNGPELAMIFQYAGSSFCPIRTVGAQLYESMTEHEAISREQFRARAGSLLEKLGFEDPGRILASYPFELSGGMQQRIGIAAAMLLNPGVLFADEPTSDLDDENMNIVLKLLREEADNGAAVFIVTHDAEALEIADVTLTMNAGTLVR